MRSFRPLLLTLATVFTLGAKAQMPYTWIINGSVPGCYPGQVVTLHTLPGTTPYITQTISLSPTCGFTTELNLSSINSAVELETPCMGVIVSVYDSAVFNFFMDTVYTSVVLDCGGGTIDCLGIPGGPDVPGAPCDDGDAGTFNDTWSPFCICAGDSVLLTDCLGVPGGPDMPGTACDDGDSTTVFDVWTPTCVCVGDSNSFLVDCLGIPLGPNLPGTPCDDGNPLTTNDVWDISCNCVGGTSSPCQANFWVIQAYDYDSLMGTATPIPYTLWVWNLSSGGSGSYTFFWDFGDGIGTSTDPFPTYTYGGNGPYLLCLTIDDGLGCTSTFCDTVSIDSLGFYNGFTGGHGEERSSGFTVNVMAPIITGIAEQAQLGDLTLWPNPVNDGLTIAYDSDRSGWVDVTIVGLDGAIVRNGRVPAALGRNEIRMSVRDVSAGLYMVRIANAHQVISQRFVKAD